MLIRALQGKQQENLRVCQMGKKKKNNYTGTGRNGNSDFLMIKDLLQMMGIGENKSYSQPNPSNICKQLIPT